MTGSFFSKSKTHSDTSLVWLLNEWLLLFWIKNIKHKQCNSVVKQMILTSRFFLVNQKWTSELVWFDSWTKYCKEMVLLNKPNKYSSQLSVRLKSALVFTGCSHCIVKDAHWYHIFSLLSFNINKSPITVLNWNDLIFCHEKFNFFLYSIPDNFHYWFN